MSLERFNFLINCLRFDDKGTRKERKKTSLFAPIDDKWKEFPAVEIPINPEAILQLMNNY